MGIPKFFRWMNDRYPGLLHKVKESQLPEIDNFYLDMNGIIHNCTHPCDGDVHFRISEEEMFEDIFNYVDTLFQIMKPKEFFFLAVDGVAPRAKMNQQRGRRFRSAREAIDREEAALKRGQILPTERRFDSNCITPGTEFMVKLNEALKRFIERKLASDPEWRNVKVILSGHETPGEGEHKIMDFIRFQRSQPSYNTNTRHCLYGLDTDLIMLGLSLHEPHFTLLREEVKFNNSKSDATKGKSQRVDPTKISFNVLHLSMLRDCIEKEFLPLKPKMRVEFDLESIIDDWILICFLIGNDFIPHIPHFHIHKNALPKILEVYQSVLTKLDGYINEKGFLNCSRFRDFAKAMSLADFENYRLLLKENGGQCAKDDYAKLNMFVRQRIRIAGIKEREPWSPRRKPANRDNQYRQHTTTQQSNVWHNIKPNQTREQTNGFQSPPRRGMHTSTARTPIGPPGRRPYNGGTPGGRIGIHSFNEDQINNSITVCADGDILDVSDDETRKYERSTGHNHRPRRQYDSNNSAIHSTPRRDKQHHQGRQNGNGRQVDNHDSSRAQDLKDFQAYKRRYYREKLKIDPESKELAKMIAEYVKALQWNLHYYYHGCVSWGWFYPYHYAPFISDVAGLTRVNNRFELGTPFKPFEQLLAVLPAASSSLLPKMYRSLVMSEDSPLAKYFPTEVEYDLNGKQNDWEAVVLAPFIDESAIVKASLVYNLFLTPEERAINDHGPHLLFYYERSKNNDQGRKKNRQFSSGTVKCVPIDVNGFIVARDQIRHGLLTAEE